MTHQIHTITVPEGTIDFVTVVVEDYTLDFFQHSVGNAVVSASFKPDWENASPELETFDDTVFAWCESIDTMADELAEYGYVVVEEGDELFTNHVSIYL
jgi:hypothetical protein